MYDLNKKLSEANSYILKGEFENAKSIFDFLLDYSPEDSNYATGYFISSYWDNRIEYIHSLKEGKEKAFNLMHLFLEFKKKMINKNYLKNDSYLSLKNCILLEIVYQIKVASQLNEELSQEINFLKNLMLELLKVEKYDDILFTFECVKNYIKEIPDFLIIQAESLNQIGKIKESNLLFQKCFLKTSLNFSIETIKSEPISKFIYSLKQKYSNEGLIKELISFMCIQEKIFHPAIEFKNEEIKIYIKDLKKLFNIKNEKFKIQEEAIMLECKIFRICHLLLNHSTLIHIDFKHQLKTYYKKSFEKIFLYLKA